MRGILVSIDKVSPKILTTLRGKGKSDAEIMRITNINTRASIGRAGASEITEMQKLSEECFSIPRKKELIRKVIPLGNLERYIKKNAKGEYETKGSEVGGCIARAEDADVIDAPQLYSDLRLDYPETGFAPNKGFAELEFENNIDEGLITRPYKVNGDFKLPQTKTGVLGSRDKIIPEFFLAGTQELPAGAVLRIYDSTGKLEMSFELSEGRIWIKK